MRGKEEWIGYWVFDMGVRRLDALPLSSLAIGASDGTILLGLAPDVMMTLQPRLPGRP